MRELDFNWLFRRAGNERTKQILNLIKNGKEAPKNSILYIGGQKIFLNPANPINSLKIYVEIFRYKDHTKLKNFPSKTDSVFFDIGANEGFYTLNIKRKFPEANIIAVEANPLAFKILKKNIRLNKLKNVIVLNMAVGSRNGKSIFEVIPERSAIGGFKLYEKYKKQYKGSVKTYTVRCITLDALCEKFKINKIDMLKMDVEGAEADILENFREINKIQKAVLEYHEAQKTLPRIKRIIKKNRLKTLLIDRSKYRGDIYFSTSSG